MNMSEQYMGGRMIRHCEMIIAKSELRTESTDDDQLTFERISEILIQYAKRLGVQREKQNEGAVNLQVNGKFNGKYKPGNARDGQFQRNSRPKHCYVCGEPGHISHDCPERKESSHQHKFQPRQKARDPHPSNRNWKGGNINSRRSAPKVFWAAKNKSMMRKK
jgi:hypothetical protein